MISSAHLFGGGTKRLDRLHFSTLLISLASTGLDSEGEIMRTNLAGRYNGAE